MRWTAWNKPSASPALSRARARPATRFPSSIGAGSSGNWSSCRVGELRRRKSPDPGARPGALGGQSLTLAAEDKPNRPFPRRRAPRVEEDVMNPTNQAAIAVRRRTGWAGSRWRSFVVRIDGRRVGKLKPGMTAEFHVQPGTHTVSVWMDWYRSEPIQIAVAPGSRTELIIRGRAREHFEGGVPLFLCLFIATLSAWIPDYKNGWVRSGIALAVFLALYGGYVLVTSILSPYWWARWILEPVETTSPSQPVSG
jgi:hypothetical protein